MARDGGHVDALLGGHRRPQIAVERQPVLQRRDAPHRRSRQMLAHDEPADLGTRRRGRLARPLHDLAVERLPRDRLLLPPPAQGGHVMGRGGAYRQIGVFLRLAVEAARALGHALHFEAQDAQPLEHARHRRRDHTQIFAADEHPAGVHERRQPFQGFLLPEPVVPVVEKVVVQFAEDSPLVPVERREHAGGLERDPGMKPAGLVGILQKEHLETQPPHAVLDPGGFPRGAGGGVPGLSSRRRHEFGFDPEEPVGIAVQKSIDRFSGTLPEKLPQVPFGDGRHGKPRRIALKTPGGNFLPAEGQGGVIVPHDALGIPVGDFPNPEEPQDVIDPQAIETGGHVPQTPSPPGVAVGRHLRPIIGGEAPVLAQHGEGIRRRAGLAVHMEQRGVGPSLDTVAVDTDGQIALERHAPGMARGDRLVQLQFEVELDKAMEHHLGVLGRAGFEPRRDLLLPIPGMPAPLGEIRCRVPVAQSAKGRVGFQPVVMLAKERAKAPRLEFPGAGLAIDRAEAGQLVLQDGLVIHLRQTIQRLPPRRVILGRGQMVGLEKAGDAQIDGMQGQGRDGFVRIRVLPGKIRGRVVHRQHLDHAQAAVGGPPGQELKVGKFPDPIARVAAE